MDKLVPGRYSLFSIPEKSREVSDEARLKYLMGNVVERPAIKEVASLIFLSQGVPSENRVENGFPGLILSRFELSGLVSSEDGSAWNITDSNIAPDSS